MCRIYHNTFFYSFFIHFIFTLYSLTTLFLLSHTTSFTFSLQSLYHSHIFAFHLYLTYAMILLVSHYLISHFAHTTLHLYLTGRLSLLFLHTSLLHISRYYLTHLKLLFQTHYQFAVFIFFFYLFYIWKLMFHFQPNHFIFIYKKKSKTHLHSIYYSSIKNCCVDSILINLLPYHNSISINKFKARTHSGLHKTVIMNSLINKISLNSNHGTQSEVTKTNRVAA